MKRFILWLALVSIAFAASATKLMPVAIDELFVAADLVAIVQITEGSVIRSGTTECGAKYRAQVIDVLKGASQKNSIEFGRVVGYEIGTRYLIFLAADGKRYDPLASTNSDAIRAGYEYETKCSSKWPRLNLIHSGTSAFRIVWYEDKWKSSRAAFIRPDVVNIPGAGYGATTEKHAYPTYDGSVYVPLDDLVKYLSNANRK